MGTKEILKAAGIVCFVLAALGVGLPIGLIPLGLALVFGAELLK